MPTWRSTHSVIVRPGAAAAAREAARLVAGCEALGNAALIARIAGNVALLSGGEHERRAAPLYVAALTGYAARRAPRRGPAIWRMPRE